MNYSTGQVMAAFDISRETVRNWSKEFAPFLSDSASPGKGKHRVFSDDDMRVFALIAELKKQGALYEDIHANLLSGQRGDLPDIDFTAIAKLEQNQQITLLQAAVAKVEFERDEAIKVLRMAQNDAEQQRGQVHLLREQLSESRAEIKELYKEIARLEAMQKNDLSK